MNSSPFENGLRLMEAQQQLAARSLIHLIEMISTTSHRYAAETTSFTQEALDLMRAAAQTRDPAALAELQQKWAQTCLKYSQNQSRAATAFVEQCGQQALNTAARNAARNDSAAKDKAKQEDQGS